MFQQIAGSFVNAFIAKKATEKDRKNKQKQIDAQMEGFNLAKPYLKQMYSGTGQAVTDAINTGTFGNTYVDYFNPLNQQFIDYTTGMADSLQPTISNQLDTLGGFGDYFDQAGQLALQNPLEAAMNYATGDRLDTLSNAALRNPYRQLMEETLPGINIAANQAGAMNSSRAGVADAIANRAFDDRSADVRSTIQDALMTQYLNNNQNMIANLVNVGTNQMQGFGDAMGYVDDIGQFYQLAGNAVYQDAVNKMTADKAAFDEARDFPLSVYQQQANIMSNAPTSVKPDANMYNPFAAAASGFQTGSMGGGFNPFGMFGKPPS